MSRRWSPGVMIDTCLDIYVQTRKHTVGPPPILLRAVHLRDLRACDIILSSGTLALCCAQRCPDNCLDTLDILCEPSGNRDISMSDIACLLISSWKILSASESSNAEVVSSLLEEFRSNCCTFRRYTDLCLRLDEDLREFTLLCMDPDSVPERQNRIPPNVNSSSTKSFFNMVAEGAGKAFNAFLSVGEQIIGGGLDEIDYMEADLLARRTRNVVAQLTQRFLNSMLISAIERADFPIIHILLDFGFRLQAVPRPSMCFQKEVDISTVVKKKNDVETRRNPIDWRLDAPGGPDWLLTALRTTKDTPILAAIRKNIFQEDVFDRLLKSLNPINWSISSRHYEPGLTQEISDRVLEFVEGMHLLMLSGAGGILPVHLMAALGRIEMLSAKWIVTVRIEQGDAELSTVQKLMKFEYYIIDANNVT
ncbi:hypothetical protein ACTXT7_015616 [Hymenolepis weldensis]